MKKRIISFLTSFIMIFSLVANVSVTNVNAESITAENQSEISADNSEVSIEGTNSFGNLLTDSLEEKMNQQEENNGCNIFSIEMIDDSTAAVSFETLQDCMLVVGIYDEAGETMLASGSLEVYAGETDTYVDIETDSMPEYFYLKAFLIDTDCFRPVCNAYESPNYTQEMQEFLAKTTEDFDQEKVLNLDDDNTNNFAVFSEDTKVIPQTEDTNDVVSVDDENNVYVVENADSSITSLQAGDTFAYEYGDNDVLIVKVADIKLDGTTATITGEDTSLEEAFDYIKIDTESNSADAQVDASNLEDGITYEGMIESEDDSEVQTYGADLGGSADLALSFKMNDKTIGSAKVSGSVDLKVSASAKVYISLSYQYIELKLDYSAKAVLALSDKGNGKMPLAYMCFSPIPGLIIEVTPSIVVETSVKAEVSGTLKGCVGFKTSNTEGMVNLTKSPTFNPEIKIEGTIFVGISLEPKVKIISDKIASASMTAKVGAEVKGVLSKKLENNENSIHECKNCIDGDINAKVTLSFEAKLMNWDSLKFTLNLVNWSVKICDFYFSYDFAEFAFTSCPHCKYKVTVEVTDSDFNKVQGATVKIDDEEYKTDENGCVTVYFNNGNYKLAAQKSEVGTAQTTLTVDDNAIKKSMCLYKNSSNCDENNNDVKLSLRGNQSAVIMQDGNLYMWGCYIYDETGWGTTDSPIPIKIMDNVKSVSIYDVCSAAITEDGSLYTWGRNYYGQLGNGTRTESLIPIKIMDNVKSVSLGDNHSAAIKEDGSLYTWGRNYHGQLGSGTTDSLSPIKITIPVEIATASVTSLLAPTCTLSTLSVVDTSIKSFSDMRANEIYNVYAIKSADAENILEADNLLYITQVLSDENGTLSVPYGFDEEYDDPVWLVVPMTQTDISSAEITVDDLQYTGENQSVKPVVKLNGETLVEGEAYYLEKDYSAVEPGEYTVIVTGFGLYKGSVEVSYKVIETNGVALRGSNLTLNGNIGLNFYFEIDKSLKDIIFADQTAKVRFTLADGSTVDVAANTGLEDTSAMEGLTLYRYSCELTAKQMADNVTVQFIMNDKVIAEYEHSVVDYAKIIIANAQNAYSAEVIALVKAMLNYGANAQLNFGYHTENLANNLTDSDGNAMVTEDEKDLSSVTAATFEPYKATGKTVDGLGTFAAANLVLKSETTLKVYFKPEDGITLDMLTFKVGNNKVTATEYGEYFMIDIPNIKASALDNKYVITVTSNTDSTKIGTFDAYVYSYCYSILSDNTGTYTEQLKDTLRALYLFNVAANKCFK